MLFGAKSFFNSSDFPHSAFEIFLGRFRDTQNGVPRQRSKLYQFRILMMSPITYWTFGPKTLDPLSPITLSQFAAGCEVLGRFFHLWRNQWLEHVLGVQLLKRAQIDLRQKVILCHHCVIPL